MSPMRCFFYCKKIYLNLLIEYSIRILLFMATTTTMDHFTFSQQGEVKFKLTNEYRTQQETK